MQVHRAVITSHTLEPLGKPALTLQLSGEAIIGAGQFLLAHLPGTSDAVRTRLFPIQISENRITCDHLPGPAWLPGSEVQLLGPLGKAFSPPALAHKWLMISVGYHPERLLPLLELGRAQSASMAFWSQNRLAALPADVERPVELNEVVAWADFVAIEIPGLDWPEEFKSLHTQLLQLGSGIIQALVDLPTPCGLGGCQACAVPQDKSWSLACQSGLVLSMEQIRG
jgi:hypothetical protein